MRAPRSPPAPGDRLSAFPLFEGADPAALARAEGHARWQDVPAGTLALDFDCPSTEVRFLARGGPLRVLLRTTGGREKILAEIREGHCFGELAALAGPAEPPSAGIRALHAARLCVLPGPVFRELVLASAPVALRMMTLLAGRVRLLNTRLLELAALPVRARLAAELLRLARPRADQRGGGLAVSPPPLQAELAARIGARREAVSRALSALAGAGLAVPGRRALLLPDPEALRAEVAAAMEQAAPAIG